MRYLIHHFVQNFVNNRPAKAHILIVTLLRNFAVG